MEPRHAIIFIVTFVACTIYFRIRRKRNGE